jgi:hypothetical protein
MQHSILQSGMQGAEHAHELTMQERQHGHDVNMAVVGHVLGQDAFQVNPDRALKLVL